MKKKLLAMILSAAMAVTACPGTAFAAETDYAASAGIYERMLREGQASVEVLVKLAILYEHRLSRPEEALRLTKCAMLLCEDEIQMDELNRRYRRLKKKTERTDDTWD